MSWRGVWLGFDQCLCELPNMRASTEYFRSYVKTAKKAIYMATTNFVKQTVAKKAIFLTFPACF